MIFFTTKRSPIIMGAIPDVGEECDIFEGYNRLYCTYLSIAQQSKKDRASANSLCRKFDDDSLEGECQFFIATALVQDLAENMSGTTLALEGFCQNVSSAPWRSECYYLLADELAMVDPKPHLKEIADACMESSRAVDYHCFNHVTQLLHSDTGAEFCAVVAESYRPTCYGGLGLGIGCRYNSTSKADASGCKDVPKEFMGECLKGLTVAVGACLLGNDILPQNEYRKILRTCMDFQSLQLAETCTINLGWILGRLSTQSVSLGRNKCSEFADAIHEECVTYNEAVAEGCERIAVTAHDKCIESLSEGIGDDFVKNLNVKASERCNELSSNLTFKEYAWVGLLGQSG